MSPYSTQHLPVPTDLLTRLRLHYRDKDPVRPLAHVTKREMIRLIPQLMDSDQGLQALTGALQDGLPPAMALGEVMDELTAMDSAGKNAVAFHEQGMAMAELLIDAGAGADTPVGDDVVLTTLPLCSHPELPLMACWTGAQGLLAKLVAQPAERLRAALRDNEQDALGTALRSDAIPLVVDLLDAYRVAGIEGEIDWNRVWETLSNSELMDPLQYDNSAAVDAGLETMVDAFVEHGATIDEEAGMMANLDPDTAIFAAMTRWVQQHLDIPHAEIPSSTKGPGRL